MRRREAIALLGGAAVASPQKVGAQLPPQRIARVAILSPGANDARSVYAAFRTRLRELGYEEGRNITLEFHFADGGERLAELAQSIVRSGADLVFADGRLAAEAMHAASRTIPIVAIIGNPVELGLAASLAHPGGNMTGIAAMSSELDAKRLEFLRGILPSARRIGVINVQLSALSYRALEDRAASLGVTLRHIYVHTQADAERELTPAALADVDGLVVAPNPLIVRLSTTLVQLIGAASKPAIYGDRDFVAAGGLVIYNSDTNDSFRRAASLVDRVLKGADPSVTPFERPMRINFVINLKTAKALGLDIPLLILGRADEVIE